MARRPSLSTKKHMASKLLKKQKTFSKLTLLLFAGIFGLIGGYIIWNSTAVSPSNISYGDLNGDGSVNILALSILLSNYGTNAPSADVNGDGNVNVFDL